MITFNAYLIKDWAGDLRCYKLVIYECYATFILQPSAWDKPPVPDPENCPPPSERHRQMYKEYENDMKAAYKNKGKNDFSEVCFDVCFIYF